MECIYCFRNVLEALPWMRAAYAPVEASKQRKSRLDVELASESTPDLPEAISQVKLI